MPRALVIELAPDDASAGDALRGAAARRLGLPLEDVGDVRVRRRGIDARHGVRLRYDLTVYVAGEPVPDEPRLEPPRLAPVPAGRTPVVIVGAGPAGLFAALRLAERGIPAVVIERGKPVQARRRDLAAINKQGVVDPESNYCFGEGGAGTYSDGKLYTRAGKRGPVEEVLRTLVAHGAPASVLIDNRPHIGSNRLPGVVMRLRHTIEGAGIPVRFGSRLAAIEVDRGRVAGVRLATGEEIGCAAVVLAAGHSARDVLAIVARAGVRLEPKPFAAGVRVEHPQPLIDAAQYGRHAGHPMLPAASYRFATTVDGRGVFSFCMCPGGWIVPSATEQDAVVVNGMSLSRRDSPFANSGVVVAIEPADLERLGY
ncbi:MAG: uncharacterized protein QOD06_1848, partial [Candidatus Binatota bacterium]|nr:uncharacterized protein [Candidatus Binatota bacterium]